MNISEVHRGPNARTAGRSKQVDACMRLWQDMPAPAHASLAKEMHTPKSCPGACIPCIPQLKVYRLPNRTLINHYSIQMLQSARVKASGTHTINSSAWNSHGGRISQAQRCTRRVHTRRGACIFSLSKMHAYNMVHAPMGVILACCCQNHLQLGVSIPREPMVGVLPSRRPILGFYSLRGRCWGFYLLRNL